jgi:hypothetical protein
MLSTTGGQAAISPLAPARPRLRLQPDQSVPTLLDGGWWPRSDDPAAELPGLILALDKRHGRITRVLLGTAGWDASRPHRLRVDGPAGSRVVRLGWFATMPAGLLTAISAGEERTDLVTIPPPTSEQDARAAMEQAAQAGNREHAPAILAVISAAAGSVTGRGAGSTQPGAGEWEPGQLHDDEAAPDRARPVSGGHPPCLPAVGARAS